MVLLNEQERPRTRSLLGTRRGVRNAQHSRISCRRSHPQALARLGPTVGEQRSVRGTSAQHDEGQKEIGDNTQQGTV